MGDDGAKCLAAVSRHCILTSVDLSSPPPPQLLTRAPSLRHLAAGGCGIGDEGASSIAQALARNRSLKTLDLR